MCKINQINLERENEWKSFLQRGDYYVHPFTSILLFGKIVVQLLHNETKIEPSSALTKRD